MPMQSCGQVCVCVVQTLLPRIVQLWQDLHVPLVHRSRFYLAFRGRETFYYEAEHRRLIHQQTQVKPDLCMYLSYSDGQTLDQVSLSVFSHAHAG